MDNISEKFFYELNPGERILWTGQPKQGFLLRPSDVFMIPFSLLWGGFAIFWETSVLFMAAFPMALFGIPFVVVGLYMIVGRFFGDNYQRSKTYYALTNERAIILSGVLNQTTRSIDIKKLPEINISTRNDGSGTITFGALHPMGWMAAGGGMPNMGRYNLSPSFDLIEDANTVYQLIKRAQRE